MRKIVDLLSQRIFLALTLCAIGVLTLAIVYTAEYGFNLLPCPLCIYQRKPYFLVILFSLLAAVVAKRKPHVADFTLMLCGFFFVTGMGISGFHLGVEQGWWEGLKSCGDVSLPVGGSTAELKAYLSHRPIVDCRVAGGKFIGISMTGYNFILSTIMAVVTFVFARRASKARQESSSLSQ